MAISVTRTNPRTSFAALPAVDLAIGDAIAVDINGKLALANGDAGSLIPCEYICSVNATVASGKEATGSKQGSVVDTDATWTVGTLNPIKLSDTAAGEVKQGAIGAGDIDQKIGIPVSATRYEIDIQMNPSTV